MLTDDIKILPVKVNHGEFPTSWFIIYLNNIKIWI